MAHGNRLWRRGRDRLKKVVIRGERDAGLVDAPEPKAKDDWVVIKVHAAPMCTEYKGFLAGAASAFLGHEAAGEVVDVAQPGRVKVGDRVVAMPLDGCGRCELCVAGDYIHCEHRLDLDGCSHQTWWTNRVDCGAGRKPVGTLERTVLGVASGC
jgi:threonine dehydrogenase-like Zn-dependent dehydrogenase